MGETVDQCYARIKAHGLTLKQQSAVDLLVAGNNDTKTAELLGVARTTVSKWRLYDPAFQAALQARRADVWGSSLDQLRSLIPKAIARVAQELDHKLYSYEAAMALLRLIKIPSLVPTGPSSPDQVIEDLTTERMMARRHACMEEVEQLTGLKDRFPAPELERERTREDVMGVLAHRVHDVGPSKSDPWETRLERAKAYASQAPADGTTEQHSATPVPSEPGQPTAESITPAAATPEAASAAPVGSIMPEETQRLSEKEPDSLSPRSPASCILSEVLHNQGDEAPFQIASQAADANVELTAEPPPPATPAARHGAERTTTFPLAAPATLEPENNGEERSATPVPPLHDTPDPARTDLECPPAAEPARPADPAAGNKKEHTITPAAEGPDAAAAGGAASPPPPDPEDAWVRKELRELRAKLAERRARVAEADLEIIRTAEALSGRSIMGEAE